MLKSAQRIYPDASPQHLARYVADCERLGVRPEQNYIYLTARNEKCADGSTRSKYVPILSIDFLRLRAHGSGAYAGQDPVIYTVGDDGEPLTSSVTVYRIVHGVRCGFSAEIRVSEFMPDGREGYQWRKKTFHMLGKCVEGLALRKGFADFLGEISADSEGIESGPEPEIQVPRRKSDSLEDLAREQEVPPVARIETLAIGDSPIDDPHDPEPAPAPEAVGLVLSGILEQVASRTILRDGQPVEQWAVKVAGGWLNVPNKSLAEDAKRFEGQKVDCFYRPGEKGKKVLMAISLYMDL